MIDKEARLSTAAIRSALALALLAVPALAADATPSARSIGLKVIGVWFADHDIAAVRQHIAADADRKGAGPGSLIEKLDKLAAVPAEAFDAVTLDQVKFFTKDGIDALAKEHPDDMWRRLRDKIGDGVGVLAVLDITGRDAEDAKKAGRKPVGLVTLVIKDVDGRPQVVYAADN